MNKVKAFTCPQSSALERTMDWKEAQPLEDTKDFMAASWYQLLQDWSERIVAGLASANQTDGLLLCLISGQYVITNEVIRWESPQVLPCWQLYLYESKVSWLNSWTSSWLCFTKHTFTLFCLNSVWSMGLHGLLSDLKLWSFLMLLILL